MTEEAQHLKRPLGLMLAGGYAAFLAAAVIFGYLSSIGSYLEVPHNAVSMPVVSMLIALVLGGTAFGLLRPGKHSNLARLSFFAVAPWGALALGSAFPHRLWQDDIPYTFFLFFIYAPLTFLISRPGALKAVGEQNHSWLRRGGALLLVCVIVMIVAYMSVTASKPRGGGSFLSVGIGLNDYVKRKVICHVPLWHYIFGLIAVSIPTKLPAFLKRGEAASEQDVVSDKAAEPPSDKRDAA
ncbi:MAG: hypothetical protein KDI90_08245 [Alphaproteobacteria bacterium]|nr:hypothetical protein [Alphaproteobacteria bacterium]MCB9975360.1 hypothetical protein [Rhodospirillales bacterium]